LETTGDIDAKLESVLLQDKATLGKLLRLFAAKVELPPGFQHAFEQTLEQRNVFVHKLFMQPWFDLSSAEGRERVRGFMREHRMHLKTVLHVLLGVTSRQGAARGGPAVRARVDAILQRINQTVRPDFGGLSEEEFVDRVLFRAATSFRVPLKVKRPPEPRRRDSD
jgi:hypothetical protein